MNSIVISSSFSDFYQFSFETSMDTEFSHGSEVVQEKFSTEQQLGRALLGLHLSCLLLAQRTSHRRGSSQAPSGFFHALVSPSGKGLLLWPLGLGSEGTWHTVALFPDLLCFLTFLHSKTWKFSSEWVFISGSKL